MKTLLRHTRTGLYLQGPKQWTNDPQAALDFRFIDHAVRYVETWELREVELAFAFENPFSVSTASLDRAPVRYAA